jgi:TonB family protein
MVDQLRIVESSGHEILDAAALEAVARSVPLPISDHTARVSIPVVFSLH